MKFRFARIDNEIQMITIKNYDINGVAAMWSRFPVRPYVWT